MPYIWRADAACFNEWGKKAKKKANFARFLHFFFAFSRPRRQITIPWVCYLAG